MKNKLFFAVLSVAMLSGCSSIFSKSDYAVSIDSNPDGANFMVTNKVGKNVQTGTTPSTIVLKSSAGFFQGENYTIEFKKPGYATKVFTLTSTIDGWYFGNILLGGVIGMLIVDPLTGAMYNLQDTVNVSLDQNISSTGNEDTLTIATIDSLTASQIAQLELIK